MRIPYDRSVLRAGRTITCTVLSVALMHCNTQVNHHLENCVTIKGSVKSIPDGKVYLVEAQHWRKPIDSTVVKAGQFIFSIDCNAAYRPFMAGITYPDSSSPSKLNMLAFINKFIPPRDTSKAGYHQYGAFYLEAGVIEITEDPSRAKAAKIDPFITIRAGRQNEVMYRNARSDFGWIGNVDSLERCRLVTAYESQVKRFPFSYYLLDCMYSAKEQYSKEELGQILSLFDTDLQNSAEGRKIATYLSRRPSPNDPLPNMVLLNADNHREKVIEEDAALNVLVFWASWCKPCRSEIPLLKKISARFTLAGVKLKSISLDSDKSKWKTALAQESMNWPQYITDSSQMDWVKEKYNFSAIPMIVFTDSKGREIKRFTGAEKDTESLYMNAVRDALDRRR